MRRRQLIVDLAAVIWAVVWILVAVQVAVEVKGLRDLSSTVIKTGAAVRESGELLQRLERVPLVGGELDGPAARVEEAGQSAVESGQSSRNSIRNLSLLLALAIGVIPSVAILGVYIHLRRDWAPRAAAAQPATSTRQAVR